MTASSILPRYMMVILVSSVCSGCSQDEADHSGLPATVTLLPPSEQDTGLHSGVAEWALTLDLRIGDNEDLAWTRVRQLLPDEEGGLRFFDSEELIVLGPTGRIRSRSGRSGHRPPKHLSLIHI